MQFRIKLSVAACALVAATASQAQIYKATMSGANQNPPVVTNGSGTVVVSLNTTTHELRVKSNFSGLNGNTTASHIHCCVVVPTANAGVLTATPSFAGFPNGVKEANFDATYNTTLATTWSAASITANGGTPAGAETAFATGIAAGGAYMNIHSATSPGGEIRGNLQRFSFVPASSALTASVAGALDSLGAGTGAVNERLITMAMSSSAQQGLAMAALLPASTLAVATVAGNGLFADYDQIGNRLGGLRAGDSSGLWVKAASYDGEHALTNRGVGVDSDGWDAVGGFDFAVSDSSRLGLAFSLAESSLDYTGAGVGAGADLEGWRATVYGEQRFSSVFIEGMLTTAQYDLDGVRHSGAGSVATYTTDADQWGGRLAAGLRIEHDNGVLFTPQLRVDWSSFELYGYSEAGAGGMALNVRSKSEDRLRLSIGGQLDWDATAIVKPYVRAFWGNELENDDSMTAASFAVGGSLFTVTDAGLESSGYTLGIGVNVLSSDTFAASLGYDRYDGDNVESNSLQVKALWRF